MFTIPELALPAGVGAAATFLVPLLLRRGWSKTARRWWSLLITAGVAWLVLALDPAARAETWTDLTASIAAAIGAGQAAYAILNPLGIYDLLDQHIDQTENPPPSVYQPQRATPGDPEEGSRDIQ